MLRKALLGLVFGLGASCAYAQAPSPADVGISKGTPDTFKLKGHDNAWTPFGSVDPSTHIFIPGTNGSIAPNDCVKWGPGLTSAGAACNSVTGGAHPANQLTIYTSHAGLVANVTTPTEAWTVVQQGFYAPGDGGDATYNWNAASYCAGGTSGTPVVADNVVCVLPIGQSASTAGRYILSAEGEINARQVGMQPGGFDNSPYVQALMSAVSAPVNNNANHTPGIVIPPVLGQSQTSYYFSKPFTLSRPSIMDCKTSNITGYGGVELVFAPGVDGVRQESGYLTPDGYAWGEGDIRGCSIVSLSLAQGKITPGTGNANSIDFRNDTDISSSVFFAPGDGVLVAAHFGQSQIVNSPGDTVGVADATAKTMTLANGAVFKTVYDPVSQVILYDFPANLAYTYQSTINSDTITVTAGPEVLKPGDMIWSDAYVFGTMVMIADNHLTAATVHTGGSGYVGSSGTMTYYGSGPVKQDCATDGYNRGVVLNVTASGGAITGVTGIADAGECLRGMPLSGATGWIPGGGLSGGGGATFNTTFVQQPTLKSIDTNGVPKAHVAHSSGSPGKMWVVPEGVKRRAQSDLHNSKVSLWPIDLDLICATGANPTVGCNGSSDERNLLSYSLVGRLTRGNVTGVSSSMNNIYATNFIADIAELGTIGSSYFNEETVSVDNGTSANGIVGNCGIAAPVFYSPYVSGQTSGYCVNTDIDGNIGIGVGTDPERQASALFIAPFFGGITPTLSAGQLFGSWNVVGQYAYTDTAETATPSGNVIVYRTNNVYHSGLSITDVTNAVIPAGTTIAAMWSGHIQLSNNLIGGGVQVGDKIQISGNGGGPCFNLVPGLAAQGANGFQFTSTCVNNEYSISLDGYSNSWNVAGVHYPLGNYLGYNTGVPVFQGGLQVGTNDGQDYFGQERMIDSGNVAPTGGLPGDVHLNNQAISGGYMAWINTSLFNNFLNADLAVGATSVAVYNCPPATTPVGTPVIDTVSPPTNHIAVTAHVLGTYASCAGSVLTFQAGAASAGTHDDTIQYSQWRPVARVPNDAAASSVSPSSAVLIANLMPCTSDAAVGLGIAYDGQTIAAAGYGTPVGSTTGSTHRLVFCDGTSWTYH